MSLCGKLGFTYFVLYGCKLVYSSQTESPSSTFLRCLFVTFFCDDHRGLEKVRITTKL